MGILLAVAVSRFRRNGIDLAAESALLRSHLRYAQSRAMADTVPWGVSLATGSYTLTHDGNAAGQLPGDDDHTHTLQGVTISAGTGNLTFDSWGAPSAGGHTITLSDGSSTKTITVIQNTGFVQ
jgi:MSHA pilin protein MshC